MTPSCTHRARPSRRVPSIAAALLVLALVTATASAARGASAAPSASAGAATITSGFPPRWAVAVDDTAEDFQYGFAVDRLGNSYTASKGSLVRVVAPTGDLVRTIVAQGTGTLEPRGLTVSEDLEVTVVGNVTGTVTVGTPPHHVTLAPDNGGAEFMIRFDRFGNAVWGRVFGENRIGVPSGEVNIFQLHQQGDVLLLNGQYNGPLDIDGITLEQPDNGGVVSGLLAGFDAATGEATWLTGIDVLDEELEHPFVFPNDGAADEDSFAVVGSAGGDFQVQSSGATSDVACNDQPDGGCHFLVVVDPATGQKTLARSLELAPGPGTVENVALIDDGFLVVKDGWDPGAPDTTSLFRLDGAGAPVSSTELTGDAWTSGLEVDGNGDVVVAGSFAGTITLGAAPGAPTMTATGEWDSLVVELDASGALKRWTSAGGAAGVRTTTTNPALAIGPNDEILLTGRHTGPIAFGSGPGSVDLPGVGTYLASYRADAPPPGSTFHAITPTRLLDSRTPTGGWNGKLAAGAPRALAVVGVLGLPADASAVVLNVTATDVTDMTYLTAWPSGVPQPNASILNVVAGDTIANHATVQVGADGTITLATAQGSMNVVADILGYYMPAGSTHPLGSGYHTLEPVRILDSRTTTGGWNAPLLAGTPRNLKVKATNGVPAGATAVVLSVTVTDTSDLTFLRVQPTGRPASNSNIAVNPGQTITNLVTTATDTGGQITFTNNTGTMNVVADLVGYYGHEDGGATFHPISPTRVLDSRNGTGGPATPWGPGTVRTVSTAAIAPVGSITAVAANLTATDTTAMSLLTLFPAAPRPGTSNLLFTPGQTIAAAANTGVAPDGTVSLFNKLGTANLILDIDGYFVAPPAP